MKQKISALLGIAMAFTGCNEQQSSAVGPSDEAPKAARFAKEDFGTRAFWPNGVIPVYISTEITQRPTPNRLLEIIRQSMAQWEAGTNRAIDFQEVASSYSGKKLTITYGACEAMAGGAAAYSSGTPQSGMTVKLCEQNQLISDQYNDPRVMNATAPYFEGTRSVLSMVSHELGHTIGLNHEDGHANFRSKTYPVTLPGSTGCPADPYAVWDAGVVVASLDPDFQSIMSYGFTNCAGGGWVRFYKNSDKRPVNGNAGDTGAISAGDFETVRAIYAASHTNGLKWNGAWQINLQVLTGNPTVHTAIENMIKSNAMNALDRWLITLDPATTGNLALRAKMVSWVVPGGSYSGPTIRVSVDPYSNAQDFNVQCNPSLPTNFCEVTLGDAVDASGNHLLTNQRYVTNIMQAAFGYVLGLSPNDPNSAVYLYNQNLSSKWIFPTDKDVKGLRSIYGSSSTNYAPLIRLQKSLTATGDIGYYYVTSWTEAELAKNNLEAADILGRVPLFGGQVAGSAPTSTRYKLNLGQYTDRYAPGFQAVWGQSTIASLATPKTACPAEAKEKASAIVATGILGNAALFTTSQTGATNALRAYWDDAGHWVVRTGTILGKSCQVQLGYVGN